MVDKGVKSLIAAPLTDTQGSLGMIAMTSQRPESPFGDRELELLVSIASISSLRIRNLLLTEDAVRKSFGELDPPLNSSKSGIGLSEFYNIHILDIGFHNLRSMGIQDLGFAF